MLPKRRHSIQTVPPAKIQTGDEDQITGNYNNYIYTSYNYNYSEKIIFFFSITDEEQIHLQKQMNKGTRRQSIAESIQLMTKSVSK